MKTIFDNDITRLPAYIFLAKMGKKVLRPGGIRLSQTLLENVSVTARSVLEFAPGRGATANLIIKERPLTYHGIEHHADFAAMLHFKNDDYRVVVGSAHRTCLAANSRDVAIGEAFLSLQADAPKEQILKEACRVLRPGGFYLLHELTIADGITPEKHTQLLRDMKDVLKVNASPLRTAEWVALAQRTGFAVVHAFEEPMALLNRKRMIQDEGFLNVLRVLANVLIHRGALKRIRAIRSLFTTNKNNLNAIGLILQKI